MQRSSRIFAFVAFVVIALLLVRTSRADADTKIHFDIPAEALDKALRDFAVQANCNIAYEPTMLTTGVLTPVVKGEYTRAEVLSLLLNGSKLTAVGVDQETVHIVKTLPTTSDMTTNTKKSSKSARTDHGAAGEAVSPDTTNESAHSILSTVEGGSAINDEDRHNRDLQEITVTGTHIRGSADASSPVDVYTRDDIDATGANTVAQFLQTLPQNFGGGASENTVGGLTGNGQTNNSVNGSAPNLRGLGTDATLVLINGHRVAPGSDDASFVDVSMIPLAAIDRVEIVTDGASAIYGSDAVGGVVNFILKNDFEGAETRLQYGSVTDGSMRNVQAGQTFGKNWGSGSATVSYQYFDQTPLRAADRDYLKAVPNPFDLLPEQFEQAVFASAKQDLPSNWQLHGDLSFEHRTSDSMITLGDPVDGYATQSLPSQIWGYSATIGSTAALGGKAELALSATYSESDTNEQTYQTASEPSPLFADKTKADVISIDANLDGVLGHLPAGDIRYAVGGQYRKEAFANDFVVPADRNSFHPSRNVRAGYVEFRIPLLARSADIPNDPTLQLTVADREERYSDFGSTNNPHIGIAWKPVPDISVRGTYGTSFKAPLLSQLNPVPSQVVIFPAAFFNPGPGGAVDTLTVYGGNPNLRPEKATNWTIGLDLKSTVVPGMSARLTYYNIVFKDEIGSAASSVCICNIYAQEAALGNQIVQRNPSPALIQELVEQPNYVNFFGGNPATVGAIFDGRSLNLSTVKTSGLDIHVDYKGQIGGVTFGEGLDATYIIKFDNQFTALAPVGSELNTEFNPTDLRVRVRSTVSYARTSAGLYLNYTNAYTNNLVVPNERVASWTTEDAIVSYQFDSGSRALSGLTVAFSVMNVTNREPPYLANPGELGLNYDGANANTLGRYISLHLQKRW